MNAYLLNDIKFNVHSLQFVGHILEIGTHRWTQIALGRRSLPDNGIYSLVLDVNSVETLGFN